MKAAVCKELLGHIPVFVGEDWEEARAFKAEKELAQARERIEELEERLRTAEKHIPRMNDYRRDLNIMLSRKREDEVLNTAGDKNE